MPAWETRAITTDTPPAVLWAARYEATVRLRVERARLELNEAVPDSDLRRALAIPPEWTAEPWPAQETDLRRLALHKIKTLLDFDSQLAVHDSRGIARDLERSFPAVAAAAGGGRSSLARFKTFTVEALVRLDDGQAEWSIVVPGEGELPPGVRTAELESGSPLKVLLQNVARADLLERLGR